MAWLAPPEESGALRVPSQASLFAPLVVQTWTVQLAGTDVGLAMSSQLSRHELIPMLEALSPLGSGYFVTWPAAGAVVVVSVPVLVVIVATGSHAASPAGRGYLPGGVGLGGRVGVPGRAGARRLAGGGLHVDGGR